jgi:alpha-mannosidase
MNTWPIFPNFHFDTTKKYYEILEAYGDKLPVLDRELNFEFTGCYSSQSLIKKTNRLGENYSEQAETTATLAWRVLGKNYPADKLRQAWIDTIFGHFHDILPGSGVAATREYHSGMFQKTAATTGMITTQSLRALATAVDTSFATDETSDVHPTLQNISMGAGVGRGAHLGGVSSAGHADTPARCYVIFNPTAWDRNEVVHFSVWDSEADEVQKKKFVVRMPDGREMPAQRIGQGDYWGHKYVDLAVPVSVAAMGYTAFVVNEAGLIPQPTSWGYNVHFEEKVEGGVKSHINEMLLNGSFVDDWAMENEFLVVAFDRQTGGIIKLLDKTTGRNLVSPDNPAGLLEYILERPGDMSSWKKHDPKKQACPLEVQSFKPKMNGPHAASFEAKFKLNDSTISVEYILKAGQPQLEIAIKANWLERGGPDIGTPSLRMQFPLALADAKGRYEIPYGSIERNLNSGEEVPALRWVDVIGKQRGSNATAGCALLNDCKYGYSLDGATLRVTLLRSSYEPDPLPELGEHEIRLALAPHGKTIPTAELFRMGAGFNLPLLPVSTDIHKGDLPAVSGGVVTCKPSNVLVAAVKKAEDEDAVIVRLLETSGKDTTTNVTLNTKLMGKVATAVEVDLIERPQKSSMAKAIGAGFSVMLPANGIASVKVNFKK